MNRNLVRIGGAALALAASAAYVQRRSARAERAHPPLGRFITIDGVSLHYLDEGDGPPLVLLHGLGSMVEDFVLSGLVREASKRYRVIAIDRPGYGHSERPRRFRFGAAAQAGLVRKALQALDVHRPIVLGHSWGTLVAVALALDYPEVPRSLVLASGLYFPSARLDAPLMGAPGLPLIGDLLSRTLSPLAGRALWPGFLRRSSNCAGAAGVRRRVPRVARIAPRPVAPSARTRRDARRHAARRASLSRAQPAGGDGRR